MEHEQLIEEAIKVLMVAGANEAQIRARLSVIERAFTASRCERRATRFKGAKTPPGWVNAVWAEAKAFALNPGGDLHVPLPADTITEIRQSDPYYVAAVVLAIITLLLTFAGPVMISKLARADQPTMADYYSGIPGLAVVLMGYLIKQHRKGK